jgi:hypothetical protein
MANRTLKAAMRKLKLRSKGCPHDQVIAKYGPVAASRTLSNKNTLSIHFYKGDPELFWVIERNFAGRYIRDRNPDIYAPKFMDGPSFLYSLGMDIDYDIEADYLRDDYTIDFSILYQKHPSAQVEIEKAGW